MAGEEFLFEGIRQFGAGLQGASENLAKQSERLNRAKATQKFLEANSEMLGMDPEAIRNFGVAETEAATDFLFRMAPINQAQQRIAQQQSILDAQAAAKRAEADIFADAFTQTPVETSRDAVVFGSLQQPIPQVTGADLDIIESLRRPAPQVDMTFTQADVPLAPATEAVIQPKQERPISGIESVAKTLREQPSFLDFIGDLIPKLSEKDIDKAKELMGVQSETDKVVSNFLRKEKTRAKKREELKPVTDTVGVLRPDPLPARPIPASTFDAPIPEAPAQSDFQTQAVKDIVFQSAVEAAGGVDEFLAQNRDRLAQAGDIGKLRETMMSATGEEVLTEKERLEMDLLKSRIELTDAQALKASGSNLQPKDLKEAQQKVLRFYKRARNASQNISKLISKDLSGERRFDPTSVVSAIRNVLPNIFRSSDQQQYNTFSENWVSAVLRQDSGAAVPEAEQKRYFNTYIPKFGDSDETVEAKLRLMQSTEDAMREVLSMQGLAEDEVRVELDRISPIANIDFINNIVNLDDINRAVANGQITEQQGRDLALVNSDISGFTVKQIN